ncbi:MAG: helix-turn-helix domain-containing protein [Candidatus Omnitrophota bacterium]
MTEKLLNLDEVCAYLNISEKELRLLVEKGKIPAYRLGGTILRFKKEQIDEIKKQGVPQLTETEKKAEVSAAAGYSRGERIKDFFYYNDFYIFAFIIIGILVSIILF